jgi:hypothetical protein
MLKIFWTSKEAMVIIVVSLTCTAYLYWAFIEAEKKILKWKTYNTYLPK